MELLAEKWAEMQKKALREKYPLRDFYVAVELGTCFKVQNQLSTRTLNTLDFQ